MDDANSAFTDTLQGGEIYSSLEVVKNTKGYNWTVKIAGYDINKVKSILVETEEFLRNEYQDG